MTGQLPRLCPSSLCLVEARSAACLAQRCEAPLNSLCPSETKHSGNERDDGDRSCCWSWRALARRFLCPEQPSGGVGCLSCIASSWVGGCYNLGGEVLVVGARDQMVVYGRVRYRPRRFHAQEEGKEEGSHRRLAHPAAARFIWSFSKQGTYPVQTKRLPADNDTSKQKHAAPHSAETPQASTEASNPTRIAPADGTPGHDPQTSRHPLSHDTLVPAARSRRRPRASPAPDADALALALPRLRRDVPPRLHAALSLLQPRAVHRARPQGQDVSCRV